ncbi:hypothetical protein [Nostoc sp. UIC 10630]|uniref:hypothetical protein n=1 Tax=Nostoc sp. UIC 10630 TaxID=2100146 RepID=UPI0013D667C6|nr:hypothetical protein [Nostoc sp. UIC 10630]NEU82856.1 hypothetical protein [Nostoc sp. UIC 10630]
MKKAGGRRQKVAIQCRLLYETLREQTYTDSAALATQERLAGHQIKDFGVGLKPLLRNGSQQRAEGSILSASCPLPSAFLAKV